jgi:hypothetical protein
MGSDFNRMSQLKEQKVKILLAFLLIICMPVQVLALTFTWSEPTTYTDSSSTTLGENPNDIPATGTAYNLYYRAASRDYNNHIGVTRANANCTTFPGTCQYAPTIPAGNYFFAITALTNSPAESNGSNEVTSLKSYSTGFQFTGGQIQ